MELLPYEAPTQELISEFPEEIEFRLEEFINRKIPDARMIMAIPEGEKYVLWIRPASPFLIFFGLPAQFSTPCSVKSVIHPLKIGCLPNPWPNLPEQFFYVILFPLDGRKKGIAVLDVLTPSLYELSFLQKSRKILPYLAPPDTTSHPMFQTWMIGLPKMCDNFTELIKVIENLPYKVISIKFCNKTPNYYWMKYFPPGKKYQGMAQELHHEKLNSRELNVRKRSHHAHPHAHSQPTSSQSHPTSSHPNNQNKKIWVVEKQLQPDIYLLVDLGEYCLVNNLTTSKWMNQLFTQVGERRQLACEWVASVRKWRPIPTL